MAKNTATVLVYLAILVGPWPFWILWHFFLSVLSLQKIKKRNLPTLYLMAEGKGNKNEKGGGHWQMWEYRGGHHEDEQKTENDRYGQKHCNCPCIFGHFGWAMAFLDFMTSYAFPFFFTRNIKVKLPTLYLMAEGKNKKGRGRWPLTKLKI